MPFLDLCIKPSISACVLIPDRITYLVVINLRHHRTFLFSAVGVGCCSVILTVSSLESMGLTNECRKFHFVYVTYCSIKWYQRLGLRHVLRI